MDLGDIIDTIVDKDSILLEAVLPHHKESMRVTLLQKFKRHCELLDSVGFLPPELEGKTLSFRYDKHKQELVVSLTNKRTPIEWKVVTQ